ncbi:tRNA pseudouridine(55) synthase TruB [Cohnella pontilimi]|uniref:tRNA pseudouridine synthase B n=1 Tax=Cohnella pontilimi TaxID=2564100 RepID=A0A4U0FFJ2_9BACL|nr:tRNA pseudouridine(55) synthase TruB [Cohnella pontilimi]TJY43144.1 tRNA pseudouridine(55) synthase TruB [Cohnella pontilimi]
MNVKTSAALEGVLAIWKPAGWTSHDVVAKARRLLRERRIGHTGTLDPAVTGVLPLCIGRATRFVEYLQELPKTYEATLRFGIATDTEDLEGTVIEEADASFLTEERMRDAVLSFVGEIDQVPPMVSAVKVNGKRLYELAREGVTVERKARRVTIHEIEILEVRTGTAHPEIRFRVRCSKGTYIRTLCVDIGRRLGVPAVMASLIRTESAGLGREACVTLEQIPELIAAGSLQEKLRQGDRLLDHLPFTQAGMPEAHNALQGKPVTALALNPVPDRSGLWRLYRTDGTFLGLFEYDPAGGSLRAVKVFPPSGDPESKE